MNHATPCSQFLWLYYNEAPTNLQSSIDWRALTICSCLSRPITIKHKNTTLIIRILWYRFYLICCECDNLNTLWKATMNIVWKSASSDTCFNTLYRVWYVHRDQYSSLFPSFVAASCQCQVLDESLYVRYVRLWPIFP